MTTVSTESTSGAKGPSQTGHTSSPSKDAKESLKASVGKTSDIEANRVADRVVQDLDAMDGPKAQTPTTEPSPENRAKVTEFSDALSAIDARDADLNIQAKAAAKGDFRSSNQMRGEVLDQIAAHANGISDLDERDRFVRAAAPDVGQAVGQIAKTSPQGALNQLEAVGKGVSPDTGRLLVNETLRAGPAQDNLVPLGRPGNPVGDALTEARQGRTERLVELAEGTARAVVPGVDATAKLIEGDVEGAVTSAGIDLAGGAILRGGKLAIGAVVGAGALAPEEAQANALKSVAVRFGKEKVSVNAQTGMFAGRIRTFDVEVPGKFANGKNGSLRLADPRGKHNAFGKLPDENLKGIAKQLNKGGKHEFGAARKAGQFSGRYNSVQGQAELARLVMDRVTPEQLAQVGKSGGNLTVKLDRAIGLTPISGGNVGVATSVRIMGNNDGAFHLVPMP